MANPFDIPLNPSGAGTTFGWTGTSRKDLEAQNQARIAMKLAHDAGMPEDEILARWGTQAGLGDTSAIQEASRNRAGALGRYVSQTQPSQELADQSQLGPVMQEPSFDFMEQFNEQPQPRLFEMGPPGSMDVPYHPDRVERAGYLRPEPYGLGTQDLSGETAATAEIPQYGTIPEYLSPPTSTEMKPSDFDPGGRRVERPGLSLPDIISRDPEAAALLLRGDLDKYYKTGKEAATAENEDDSRRATQQFLKEVDAGGDREEALGKYEARMAQGETGRKILEQETKAEERAGKIKTRKNEQQLRRYAAQKAEELRESNPAEAHRWDALSKGGKEALSLIEKFADDEQARVTAEAKAGEAKKPTVIDGVPYVWALEGPTGQTVLRVAPGFEVKEKPWWDKLTEPQIAAVANDASQDPKVRQEAKATLADLAQQKKAGAATTTIKLPAGERKDWAETLMSLEIVDRIDSRLDAQKKNIGGPYGLKSKINTVFSNIGWGPKEFAEFRSDVQKLRAKLSHDLAGANVPVGERKLYLVDIPDIDNDSSEQFLAKYHNLKLNLTNFAGYLRRLDNGETNIPIPEPVGGKCKPTASDPLCLMDANDPRRQTKPSAPAKR
jgi:hypothetical protein